MDANQREWDAMIRVHSRCLLLWAGLPTGPPSGGGQLVSRVSPAWHGRETVPQHFWETSPQHVWETVPKHFWETVPQHVWETASQRVATYFAMEYRCVSERTINESPTTAGEA